MKGWIQYSIVGPNDRSHGNLHGQDQGHDHNHLVNVLRLTETVATVQFENGQVEALDRSLVVVHPDRTRTSSSSPSSLWEIHGMTEDHHGLRDIAKLLPSSWNKSESANKVAHFFLFCYERHCIWERRNRGEQVLTECWALQQYHFCNVYRELDRGTKYFRSQMLDLWETCQTNHGGSIMSQQQWLALVLWASLCYRTLNKQETFEAYGCIPIMAEWSNFQDFLCQRRQFGQPIFTAAHQCMGWNRYKTTMDTLSRNQGSLLKQLVSELLLACEKHHDLEQCCGVLKSIENIGPFFSWQVICDLLESRCLVPCSDNDWMQLGPGALAGIKIIFDCRTIPTTNALVLAKVLHKIQDHVFHALGLEFRGLDGQNLTLKNMEHALCEFSKYMTIIHSQKSVRHGQRRRKSPGGSKDLEKHCFNYRKCGNSDNTIVCDNCLDAYCLGCASDQKGVTWKCIRCKRFESILFTTFF